MVDSITSDDMNRWEGYLDLEDIEDYEDLQEQVHGKMPKLWDNLDIAGANVRQEVLELFFERVKKDQEMIGDYEEGELSSGAKKRLTAIERETVKRRLPTEEELTKIQRAMRKEEKRKGRGIAIREIGHTAKRLLLSFVQQGKITIGEAERAIVRTTRKMKIRKGGKAEDVRTTYVMVQGPKGKFKKTATITKKRNV